MTPQQNTPKARLGMTDQQIDEFIQAGGGIGFPNVVFRKDPGADFTTPFGIDTSTGDLTPIRCHLGTDRAKGRFGEVHAPFAGTFQINESADYGNLFRLNVGGEIEIRIGHMKLQKIMVKDRPIPQVSAGELIGLAGSEGKSTGVHTHTEVVSLHGESALCEAILKAKGLPTAYFTPEELQHAAGPLWPKLHDDMVSKGVLAMSRVKIQKLDRWTGIVQTYYDSRTLFGF